MTTPKHEGEAEVSTPVIHVLYDRKSGKIVHVHAASGVGRLPKEADLLKRAFEVGLRITGRSRKEIEALRIDENDLVPGVAYKVDVRRKVLLKLKPPKLTPKRRPTKRQ
jgi:hypothetical protein